jgi:triosephosphate isomerase (TIM)
MKRIRIVAGNWKMNKDFEAGMSLASEIIPMIESEVHHDLLTILFPPFVHIHALASLSAGKKAFAIGAQDCSAFEAGAYTGEVAASMIKSAGAEYVLVGHSERRQYHGETELICQEKIKRALEAGLKPIYCIGELKEQRVAGTFEAVIINQLQGALQALSTTEMQQLVLAYEPVWAIGTGLTASPEQAQEVHALIRKWLAGQFGSEIADRTSILYGGSVNASNAQELFGMPDIDGGLVGGASLKSRDFTEIAKANH